METLKAFELCGQHFFAHQQQAGTAHLEHFSGGGLARWTPAAALNLIVTAGCAEVASASAVAFSFASASAASFSKYQRLLEQPLEFHPTDFFYVPVWKKS